MVQNGRLDVLTMLAIPGWVELFAIPINLHADGYREALNPSYTPIQISNSRAAVRNLAARCVLAVTELKRARLRRRPMIEIRILPRDLFALAMVNAR